MSTIRGKDVEVASPADASPPPPQSRFHLDLPRPDFTMTLAQNMTPGWDSPWSPRPPADLVARITTNGTAPSDLLHGDPRDEDSEKLSIWARRKKKIRVYMLTNTYVPLVSLLSRYSTTESPTWSCATLFSYSVLSISRSQPLLSAWAFVFEYVKDVTT